ncbi:unnamed protein product [Ranitomeya imitator]|uniref:Ig-like domain-containing protein n=1 Tax=Ranitomeya imitator TaxID=111125 RepID=A0ABN9M7L9_9NEOB|nr:unnamed protein product [Ranitomeya imitator]
MKFSHFTILFLLQKLSVVQSNVLLLQPPAVAALLGSSVNLSCHMQVNGVKLVRVNLYWLIPLPNNNKFKERLHPKTKNESDRSRKSRLIYPNFTEDLSLTIEDVQLSYTDTYICETSLVIGEKNKLVTGNGTYLLVYDDLMTFMNQSDIVCKVEVQAPQDVDLVWDLQGQEDNVWSSVIPASHNSYWIVSVMMNWTQRCQENRTFTCKLRYKGQSLVEHSMEAPCAGDLHFPPHPTMLYILILGNSFLILIIIIVLLFFLVKRKKNRKVQVVVPYANFSNTSRKYYNH